VRQMLNGVEFVERAEHASDTLQEPT